ncbi:tetratricopeptide repeat protein [Roseovarius salis]|uniref:tetratricopeptide repeat protein n=1 Tax=Roseovarius salis TaxID=3376063 RepID=UPI0037C89346
MESYFDLGDHSFPVTTDSDAAQLWFDRGLLWTYGYNHEEAVSCFDNAIAADPACAMAHWGRGYAVGPNYNMDWELFDEAGRAAALAAGHEAAMAAMTRLDGVSDWEAAMIRALPARYPQAGMADIATMKSWDRDFADAMRTVHAAHPGNLDICTVFVEALLNLTPWKMWDLPTGRPAEGAFTEEAQKVLEEAMERRPGAMRHPGLLHLYVHLMEMSPHPEKALKAADVLRRLVPDAGHLIHMPTHIDVLCGQYQNVVDWNEAAVAADEKYWREKGAFNIYSGYRLHDYHFVIYGAMLLGQIGPALRAVRGAEATVPEDMLRMESPPMADYFEAYLSFEPHVLVRFGRWREATELALPEDPELYCTLAAHVHYARGIGHAALGEVDAALAEEKLYHAAMARVPESRLVHNNKVVDLLAIGAEMLRGEILYREGRYDEAFAALRRSVALDDTLPYDEPWGWMQPTRHALGALLLEQDRVAEAEALFREDLGLGGQLSRATVHPDNVWSLKGLHDCLKARGETVEIVQVRQRLDLAQARADRTVAASCFCAQAALRAAE